MKKETYTYPHSSFLSIEKDMNIIINKMFENDRLKKYLLQEEHQWAAKNKQLI